MQALTASNSDMDLNPLIRLNLQTTRTWNDRGGLGVNGDYVPQCDLLESGGERRMRRDGQPELRQGVLHAHLRSGLHQRLRQAAEQLGDGRLACSRRWRRASRSRPATTAAGSATSTRWTTRWSPSSDFTQFSVPIPLDPRLPGGGGGAVAGVYNLNPNKVGQVQDLAVLDEQGRRRPDRKLAGHRHRASTRGSAAGSTIQAGTSTGRTLQDNCALRSLLPETYPWSTITVTQSLRGDSAAGLTRPYCRIVDAVS